MHVTAPESPEREATLLFRAMAALCPKSLQLRRARVTSLSLLKGYIDGRAKEHTLGCFSSSRLYNQEVKRRLGAGQCHLRVLTINIGEESV